MRKTKIVCTLGPATDDENVLKSMMLSGMDCARFNFSHGDHASHKKRHEIVKRLRAELGMHIATLLDTKGPEIRIGKIAGGKTELTAGNSLVLTTEECECTSELIYINYKNLPSDVVPGTRILIDDGLIELKAERADEKNIYCKIINGGVVSNNKSINVPGIKLSMPYLSDVDKADIAFGVEQGFDFIATSFTRTPEDVITVRNELQKHNCHNIKIIAKIENGEGVSNIDGIIAAADGIMVARGDMGVEIDFEQLPHIQKTIIKKVYNAGKIVITATQMLESMIKNPRPTRAEISDIANAIYDGTSAIMLSGETAAGAWPVEAVQTMQKIALSTESDINYHERFSHYKGNIEPNVTNAISHATCTTAMDLGAAAIVTVTKSGQTARLISKYRPATPIVGCTIDERSARQLSLSWGITPVLVEEQDNTDELFEHAVAKATKAGLIKSGDLIVITAGVPLGVSGTTNLLKVHLVGDILVSGKGYDNRSVCSCLCVCKDEEQALASFNNGDILVIPQTSNNIMGILKHASGIITEQGGANSHAAIVGLTLDIPVITGAVGATTILKSGTTVTLDAGRGFVYTGDQRL